MWSTIRIFTKQELIYFLLGALFGALGAHNLYLRQKKRAYLHLGLVFVSPFIGLLAVLLLPSDVFFANVVEVTAFALFKNGLFLGFALGYMVSFAMASFEVMYIINSAYWRSLP